MEETIEQIVEQEVVSQDESTENVEQTKVDVIRDRRNALELEHLRLKELEVTVLYEELNTRNLAAVKGRMQSFITIKEIEAKYNKLVEADRAASEKMKAAQDQLAELVKGAQPTTSLN
jgi:helix-turn-helix protein